MLSSRLNKKIGFLVVLLGVFGVRAAQAVAPTNTVALKNFRELSRSLSAVTGVDPSTPEIRTYFGQVSAQLPQSGVLAEYSAQSWLASIGLGSAYCDRLIYEDAYTNGAKSALNRGVDFRKGPSAMSDAFRQELIKRYVMAFLQREATVSERDRLVSLFVEQTDSTDKPTQTYRAVLSVCSALSATIEFLSS